MLVQVGIRLIQSLPNSYYTLTYIDKENYNFYENENRDIVDN